MRGYMFVAFLLGFRCGAARLVYYLQVTFNANFKNDVRKTHLDDVLSARVPLGGLALRIGLYRHELMQLSEEQSYSQGACAPRATPLESSAY